MKCILEIINSLIYICVCVCVCAKKKKIPGKKYNEIKDSRFQQH